MRTAGCHRSDYRQDMRISKDMLGHLSQNYLKIRNTARYILGNLFDFNPQTDQIAYTELPELDKWAADETERTGCQGSRGIRFL